MHDTLPQQHPLFDTLSITGKLWQGYQITSRDILFLTQTLDISEDIARVLLQKGIKDPESAQRFLNPTLKETLPSPFHLHDMEKAANRILQALQKGEKIGIFGDYDVDGATSSALLRHFFTYLEIPHLCYIPDRFKDGYGPNIEAFKKLIEQGCKLIITVDCGTTSFAPITYAQEQETDVIVIDHHQAPPELPPAYALINPNRIDQDSACGHMAAAGVTFLFLVACNKILRENGIYKHKKEPNLLTWLDLVALGTVCDVMPLTGINRTIVKQGLKIIQNRTNKGLKQLLDQAQITEQPKASHLAFQIGPRINAGGRVGKSSLGSDILSSYSDDVTLNMAQELSFLNEERKLLEDDCLKTALNMTSDHKEDDIVFVASPTFHLGIIGIVASRLKERYHVPSLVATHDEHGILKGSARSALGFDMGATIMRAVQEGILIAGGGHKMAAGFTLASDQENTFRAFMNTAYHKHLQHHKAIPTLTISSTLTIPALTEEFLNTLNTFEPFGIGNEEPRFALNHVIFSYLTILKEKHIKVTLKQDSGHTVAAMLFNGINTPLGYAIQDFYNNHQKCHIAGRAKINTWMGKNTITFFIEDILKA